MKAAYRSMGPGDVDSMQTDKDEVNDGGKRRNKTKAI